MNKHEMQPSSSQEPERQYIKPQVPDVYKLEEQLHAEQALLESEQQYLERSEKTLKRKIGELLSLGYAAMVVFNLLVGTLGEAKAKELMGDELNQKDKTVQLKEPDNEQNQSIDQFLVGDDKQPSSLEKVALTVDNEPDKSSEIINLADSLRNECNDYISHNELLADHSNWPLSWIAAVEQPTDFQIQQMTGLVKQLANEGKGRLMKSQTDLLLFINQSIDSNFQNQETAIYLKDAFPETAGEKAKKSFDCDSRAVMIMSILQEMGAANGIQMIVFKGHMELLDNQDGTLFNPSTNEARDVQDITVDELLQSSTINNLEEFLSFAIANKGTYLQQELIDNAPFHLTNQETYDSEDAIVNNYLLALKLNPHNINAHLNLIELMKNSNKYNDNKIINEYEDLISNMLNQKLKISEIEINGNIVDGERQLNIYSLEGLLAKSRFFSDLVCDYADYLQHNQDFDKARGIYEKLVQAGDYSQGDLKISISCNILQNLLSQKNFNEFLSKVDSTNNEIESMIKSSKPDEGKTFYQGQETTRDIITPLWEMLLKRKVQILKAEKLAVQIITGDIKITKDNLNQFIDDPVLGPLIQGTNMWNIKYSGAVELLKQWSGYENLVEICKKYKDINKEK